MLKTSFKICKAIVTLFLLPLPSSAEEFTLTVTNVNQNLDVNLVIQLDIGSWRGNANPIQSVVVVRHPATAPRNSERIDLDTQTITFHDWSKRFILFGRVENSSGSIVGYIPLQSLNAEDFVHPDRMKHEVPALSDYRQAFLASFPFSEHTVSGLLDSRNVSRVLFSIKRLVEEQYVDAAGWNDIYYLFNENRSFLQGEGVSDAGKILAALRSYWRVSQDPDFPNFYTQYLNAIMLYDIGGVKIENDVTIFEYTLNELMEIYSNQEKFVISREAKPAGSYLQAGASLGALIQEGYYTSCIALTTIVLRSFESYFSSSTDRPSGSNPTFGALV